MILRFFVSLSFKQFLVSKYVFILKTLTLISLFWRNLKLIFLQEIFTSEDIGWQDYLKNQISMISSQVAYKFVKDKF